MRHNNESRIIGVILRMMFIAALSYGFLYIISDRSIPHNHDRFQNPRYTIHTGELQGKEIFSLSGSKETESEFDKSVDHILSETHESANIESSMGRLCSLYPDYCAITEFDTSTLSDKQKLYYQTLIIFALKKFNNYGIDFSDYMDSIIIKNENTRSRGYSSRSQMVLNVRPMGSYSEFIKVMIHELGHFLDFDYLAGDISLPKDTTFTEFAKVVFPVDDPSLDFYKLTRSNENTRKKGITYKDFVSGYAMTDPFETLAETMHFYMNFNGLFRELVKQSSVLGEQYQFMDEIFGGQYISDGMKKKGDFEKYNRDFRPYDTTRF